jgi:hypothetical protein
MAQANLLVACIYCMAAYLFTELYRTGSASNATATEELLTNLQAHTPYQYRLLPPLLAHWLVPRLHLTPSQFFTGTTFVASVLLLYVFRAFLERYVPPPFAMVSAPLILVASWFNYTQTQYAFFYPSDLPAVTFFTAGVMLAVERQWTWYYLLFAISVINRETAVFLTAAFALVLLGKVPSRTLALHVASQLAYALVAKVVLAHVFAHNPGVGAFAVQAFANIWWLERTYFGSGPFGAIGPMPPIRETVYLTLCAFGGLWIAVPFYWRRKPEELKRLTLVVPLFLVAVFVLGNLNEKRIYSELTPIVVAHAAVALYRAAIEEHPGC